MTNDVRVYCRSVDISHVGAPPTKDGTRQRMNAVEIERDVSAMARRSDLSVGRTRVPIDLRIQPGIPE